MTDLTDHSNKNFQIVHEGLWVTESLFLLRKIFCKIDHVQKKSHRLSVTLFFKNYLQELLFRRFTFKSGHMNVRRTSANHFTWT